MTEFIQALFILSFTIIALTAIVHGKRLVTRVKKEENSIQAELSVDDIKRKK